MFLNQSLVNETIESMVLLRNLHYITSYCLKKDQKKNLVSFLVDSIAREHLAFLALTPPEFFTFPGGGSWGVLIWAPQAVSYSSQILKVKFFHQT